MIFFSNQIFSLSMNSMLVGKDSHQLRILPPPSPLFIMVSNIKIKSNLITAAMIPIPINKAILVNASIFLSCIFPFLHPYCLDNYVWRIWKARCLELIFLFIIVLFLIYHIFLLIFFLPFYNRILSPLFTFRW